MYRALRPAGGTARNFFNLVRIVLTLSFVETSYYLAVSGAECNTVIELKLEHHAA
jgi:hypothetical protein